MKISPSLERKQTLKTGYSLRQRQALEILQKSTWELEEYLQKEAVLKKVQNLDLAGVGARDPTGCLLLQAVPCTG
ncbi:MAG: Sigma-54 factor, core binding domain [Eubacteriales bacterium]|nr:Sigma-54 factor, core binding domain [Eubacteriales bacterium]